jgi:squalene-hopene/tetraprenyl-beta-curcumene cyclase
VTGERSQRVRQAHRQVTKALLAELGPDGHWSGELSASALSTATAVIALANVDREVHAGLIQRGLQWLAAHTNADGGWGDTIRSRSNLSTTALAWAAFGATRSDDEFRNCVEGAVSYIRRAAGSMEKLVPAIEALYGKDRTFSVPITMTLALSGRLGSDGWRRVRPLPFELAVLPRRWFGALRLPVVSYALPALIAIGQVIHHRSGRGHPLRTLARRRTLDVLTGLQPENGGFLEATPLTSFVTMSLAGMGEGGHVVARRGAGFLCRSVRSDGSWPIDTNLATWVTTLAVEALRFAPETLDAVTRAALKKWLLGQQYRVRHPYTDAAPGGWAWTDLPGGVPDADDTAGALLALHQLGEPDGETLESAGAGCRWLLDLQNRNGGIPTFCRGWGALPFDRSAPELTAQALRAWAAWSPRFDSALGRRLRMSTGRALHFLAASQRPDGAWVPLWFGNEDASGHENPVYGTGRVLIALNELMGSGQPVEPVIRQRAAEFLSRVQARDGTWGGDAGTRGSVEETAIGVAALHGVPERSAEYEKGLAALVELIERGADQTAAPIGLYFARLWYFERLYPLLFAAGALGRHLSEQG